MQPLIHSSPGGMRRRTGERWNLWAEMSWSLTRGSQPSRALLPAHTGQGSSPARAPHIREQNLKPNRTLITETPELTQKDSNWDILQLPFLAQIMLYSFQHRLKSNETGLRNLIAAIAVLQGFSRRTVIFLTFSNIQENNKLIHLILSNESHYSGLLWSISEFNMQINLKISFLFNH